MTDSGEQFVIWDTLNAMVIIQSSINRGTFITIMAVYVDDIVIIGDDVEEIKCLKENLGRAFEVRDLGPLRYFLGIEIARSPEGMFSLKGNMSLIC